MTAGVSRPAFWRPAGWRRLVADQRVAYVGVGIINTVIGIALFALADRTIGAWADDAWGRTWGSLVTLVTSHILAVIVAFVLHRRLVFRVRGNVLMDLLRFESVYAVGLGVNAIALPTAVSAGAPRLMSQVVILGVIAVGTYVGHKYFSFRRPGRRSST